MGVCSRALLTAALVQAVNGYPDCGDENIPFAYDVQCDNYCDDSVGGYGSTINTNNTGQGKTVSAFYMGGFF